MFVMSFMFYLFEYNVFLYVFSVELSLILC